MHSFNHQLTPRMNVAYDADDIAVIGGGPLGTYAALTLQDQGFRVRLFEKDSRAGGRIRTKFLAGRMPAEFGAARINRRSHERVMQLVRRYDLRTIPFHYQLRALNDSVDLDYRHELERLCIHAGEDAG